MADLETPEKLKVDFLTEVAGASDLAALEEVRIRALGQNGAVTKLMKALGGLPPEERKAQGQVNNAVKLAISNAIEARKGELDAAALSARLAGERIDITLPIRPDALGFIHPISQTMDELMAIFGEMGFMVAEGPDVEDDFHNFTALNIPKEHPARQMHDTFYLPIHDTGEAKLLRTHTSPVQIHTMMSTPPPHRIIALGRTYRCDSDITHTPMFHQIEGLVIDKATHMGHLKGCLVDFCRAYFEVDDLPLRFRPSYFPFTEPSCEVDIGCSRSGGELRIGSGDDWLEILGAGMVHPNVLTNCGLDSEVWQGFAFGLGIERVAMLKYGIPDLRTFFESDIRWLRHYGFSALDQPSLIGGLTR
jgi:phenylalanyl-tRNA synthetase alpha chain